MLKVPLYTTLFKPVPAACMDSTQLVAFIDRYSGEFDSLQLQLALYQRNTYSAARPSTRSQSANRSANPPIKPFSFDPNTATLEDFQKLGFSKRQAESIISVRKKWGGFKYREDFKKLYIVSDERYALLERYIQLPHRPQKQYEKQPARPKREYQLFRFDPNTITRDSLILLGLSPKQAQTFINYRNAGAVFRYREDILRCYSIDSAMYRRLEGYILLPAKSD